MSVRGKRGEPKKKRGRKTTNDGKIINALILRFLNVERRFIYAERDRKLKSESAFVNFSPAWRSSVLREVL